MKTSAQVSFRLFSATSQFLRDRRILLEGVWLHQVLVVVHLEVAGRLGVRLEQRDERLLENLFGEGVVFEAFVLLEVADPDLDQVGEDLGGVAEELGVGEQVRDVLEELGGVVLPEHVHDSEVGFGPGLRERGVPCRR